jgi:3-dehydroshikimate dehydratase
MFHPGVFHLGASPLTLQCMIRPGLVSITFRSLSPKHIIELVARAGLSGIEWGSDVHVPHGKPALAKELAKMTRDAGLSSAAYGSYYRVGNEPADLFPHLVDAAIALETRIIRVWAGHLGSDQTDAAGRQRVTKDARRISELAAAAGLTIACEWHGGTLTDTAESAKQLFADVDHPAFRTYWQPHRLMALQQCLEDMETAKPRLVGLHVFQWNVGNGDREPLADGQALWRKYLAAAKSSLPEDSFALLEFVKDDSPDQFLRDAQILRQWLSEEADPSRGRDGKTEER